MVRFVGSAAVSQAAGLAESELLNYVVQAG